MSVSVPMEVPAKLVLVPEYGPKQEATPDDLRRMRWHHSDDLYDRIIGFMVDVGLDPHDRHADLRGFVEDAIQLLNVDARTCSDWPEIRQRYIDLFAPLYAVEAPDA